MKELQQEKVAQDRKKMTQDSWARLRYVSKNVQGIKGVTTSDYVLAMVNNFPTIRIEWETQKVALTTAQALEYLRSGDPAVMMGGGPGGNSVSMTSFMLKPGEERLIAQRMKEMFKAHKA